MKKTVIQKTNAYVSKKTSEKDGKKYVNFYVTLQLNNGEVVNFQFKEAFFNKKFNYKLRQNLDEVK